MRNSNPDRWTGLGFVATSANADPNTIAGIPGVDAVAHQIAWGMNAQHPNEMPGYLAALEQHALEPVGWGWCDARDVAGAAAEGVRHAELVVGLELELYVANMEEPYDAHGDSSSPRYYMPDAYFDAFLAVAPHVELACTTTPRWASNHGALREAGAVLMGQAFSLEVPSPPGPATVDACCRFAIEWGWDLRYVRPLVQVYETNGVVPAAGPYLEESARHGVGVVPYILEQAFAGAGRALLDELAPATSRRPLAATEPEPPTTGGPPVAGNAIPTPAPGETIGPDHGITALVDYLQRQPDMPTRTSSYNPSKPASWPWPERLERTLRILAADHDAAGAERELDPDLEH